MNKLSVAIITKNEEANIDRCLSSVNWADEIVVVDSGSQDYTLNICKKHGVKIFTSKWFGFGKTKQLAVDYCNHDWILSLDADEIVTKRLRQRIESKLENPQFYGYRIKRSSYYLGQKIKHCGWDKDYPIRLFNKQHGRFNSKIVHESVEISDAKLGVINELLLHYTYPTIKSHIEKMTNYAFLGAQQNFTKKKRATIIGALFRGLFKFMKMYFLQKGILDGRYGFILSLNSAIGVYLKYLYLWEKTHDRD
jgi:glycosyltransferase involved in cell wall biosynthesis